jgi:glycosidase
MVMTDRFANGDPGNDDQGWNEYDTSNLGKYSGGDLKGLIDHLDYIQGLGATAVWITPPVANMWWDPLQQSGGFHGYWARDLKHVDEHLGTLATYQALSDALHRRGMYLIQDVVPNHMGNFFTYCKPVGNGCAAASYDPGDVTSNLVLNVNAAPTGKPTQAPFDQNDPRDPAQRAAAIYHWTPAISNYSDPVQELTYQISDLDDLNTENSTVRAALKESYGSWIRSVGVDAFRVDTAKFVPHEYWNDFFHATDAAAPGLLATAAATGRADFLAFGEVYETPDALTDALERKVVSFLGTTGSPELPSVLAFPLFKEIERVFANGQPTAYMTYRLGKLMDPSFYPNPNVIPTFIDNHDVRRFLSITESTGEGLLQALAFLFTAPGIPIVYYGTEQGFTESRASMFAAGWGSPGAVDHYGTTGALYQRVKKLAGIRKAHPALRRGPVEVLCDDAGGAGPLVYRRSHGADTVLVFMNTAKRNGQQVLLAGCPTGLPPGTVLQVLHDEQSPATPAVGAGGRITATLPPRAVLVALVTSEVVAPPAPSASITMTTPVEGQTFTHDVTLVGTVDPPTTALQLVVDANLGAGRPINVTVPGDGTWSVVLPVSSFSTGTRPHDLTVWAPGAGVATPSARFTSDVVFQGSTYVVNDPTGDDRGPAGTYTYPTDSTFGHQMDIERVTLEVGATTLNVNLTMADFTAVWNPPNGYDHVAFNIYFALPGQSAGAVTVMPKLGASVPNGFAWNLAQFSGGWDENMYGSAGATADGYGPPTTPPTVKVDGAVKTVTFTYDRNDYGLSTWSGVRIYVATWDWDGIGAAFRPLTQAGGMWMMGGGGPPYTPDAVDPAILYSGDPKIMDDIAPFTIP